MATHEDVVSQLGLTAEIYNRALSIPAARLIAGELGKYPADAVLKALSMCRHELKFFPTVADIIARIDDGRPGTETAWGMMPKSEDDSVVWTDEMSEAFMDFNALLDDPIAARMAFKESYTKLVQMARNTQTPVRWSASLGHDKIKRERVLKAAVTAGRLTADEARKLLPDCSFAQHRQGVELAGPAHIAALLPERKP